MQSREIISSLALAKDDGLQISLTAKDPPSNLKDTNALCAAGTSSFLQIRIWGRGAFFL